MNTIQNRHLLSLGLSSAVLLLAACTEAQDPVESDGLATRIEADFPRLMEEQHIPGAAVAVVRDGELIYLGGFGLANVETGEAVDPETTIFRIGSVTKLLTALSVTRLADDGRIDMNAPVSDYLNGTVSMSGDFAEPVRVWHLLTHTGGFDQIGLDRQIFDFDAPLDERMSRRPSLEEFLADDNLRRVNQPGRLFRYDTYGITLAGHLLERVTGQTYAEAMRTEMFEPLGMSNAFVETPEDRRGDLAMGYGYIDGELIARPYEVYVTTPASSIDATVEDMARLLEALTGDDSSQGARLFSETARESALAEQFRPHPDFPGSTHGFWELDLGVRALEHGGIMLGYRSRLIVFPDSGTALFIAMNRSTEGGGPPVRLPFQFTSMVIEELGLADPDSVHEDASPEPNQTDTASLAGDYVSGVYCRTCTQAEFDRGAWQRGSVYSVVALSPSELEIAGQRYHSAGERIFVREDGGMRVFFTADDDGEIIALTFSDNPSPLERVPAQ